MEFIKSSPLFHGFPKVNRMPFTQTEMYLVCVIFRDDFFGIIDCTHRAGKIFIITLFHVNSKKRATSRQMTEWNFARFCYQSIKLCLPSSLSICYYCHCYGWHDSLRNSCCFMRFVSSSRGKNCSVARSIPPVCGECVCLVCLSYQFYVHLPMPKSTLSTFQMTQ